MATSTGERARQHAQAEQTRSIDRDLSAETLGIARELSVHTGKPALVREICKKRRLRQKAQWAENRTEKDADVQFGTSGEKKSVGFFRVESIELVGVIPSREILYDDEELERLQQRLHALQKQIPEFFDFHEVNAFTLLEGQPQDVPREFLGVFRSPCRDLKVSREWEWVRALWREHEDTS